MPIKALSLALSFVLYHIVQSSCPNGYFSSQDGSMCYIFMDHIVVWNDAQQDCQNLGGNLASIHNAFDNTLITKTLKNFTGNSFLTFWLGGYPSLSNGLYTWTWIDNSKFDYTNFATANDTKAQANMSIKLWVNSGSWYAESNEFSRLPYLCEIKAQN